MSKVLVAYFSASGVTADAATELAKAVDAELFEIEPSVPYSTADLNWNNRNSRSSVEMRDGSCRPEIAKRVPDMSQYSVVFVGFPIWWDKAPSIVCSFLDSYDFTGKTVIPFATSGGSGISGSERSLKKQYPDFNWKAGKLLNGSMGQVSMAAWGKSLGIK